jgi:hypothetical protein
MLRKFSSLVLTGALALTAAQPKIALTPDMEAALERISADSLRGHLSFIASDLLEGRNTPSAGLDIAAEYVAAQFRRAGLEPGGDDGYFQTAHLRMTRPNAAGFQLTFENGERTVTIPAEDAAFDVSRAVELTRVPVFKLDIAEAGAVQTELLRGKIVALDQTRAQGSARAAFEKLRGAKPAAVILLNREKPAATGRLSDPERAGASETPRVTVTGDAAAQWFATLGPGLSGATASLRIAAPAQTPVKLRNVVAVLPGSDPALKDACVVVSAHYDHLGMKPAEEEGDRIFNGANDDGSGTVSVIEVADTLAKLKQRPRRTIVFVTFFGEEKGGFGSRYYAKHPFCPIERTIANLNLEQVGRTDSSEGPQVSAASLTGFDYSDMTDAVLAAAGAAGVRVYKHPRNSDLYFSASDNRSFADVGVPAHTLCVAFNYPDYHGVGDEWRKIDYDNMAKIDRMVAIAVLTLAQNSDVPRWNADNPKTEEFRKAWREHHPSSKAAGAK